MEHPEQGRLGVSGYLAWHIILDCFSVTRLVPKSRLWMAGTKALHGWTAGESLFT